MVTVLLATYNSERFLHEQIDSILAQKEVEVNLIARDDGSKDSTFSILKEYESQGKLRWYSDGQNLKPARGFMKMLQDSPDDSEYFAFSDHDDVWLNDKLSAAVSALEQYDSSKPALYFCQTKLVDADLKPFDNQIIIQPFCTLGEALINQFIGGCTMVFNKTLRDIIVKYSPAYLPMHDVWIYLVALSLNSAIVFDPTPHILYRQHGNNEIGQGYGLWDSLKRHYKRIVKDKEHMRQRMAQELLNGYGDMIDDKNKRLISLVADYDKGVPFLYKALVNKDLVCHNKRTYLFSKLAVILKTM